MARFWRSAACAVDGVGTGVRVLQYSLHGSFIARKVIVLASGILRNRLQCTFLIGTCHTDTANGIHRSSRSCACPCTAVENMHETCTPVVATRVLPWTRYVGAQRHAGRFEAVFGGVILYGVRLTLCLSFITQNLFSSYVYSRKHYGSHNV